jgi:hypothetical protein
VATRRGRLLQRLYGAALRYQFQFKAHAECISDFAKRCHRRVRAWAFELRDLLLGQADSRCELTLG